MHRLFFSFGRQRLSCVLQATPPPAYLPEVRRGRFPLFPFSPPARVLPAHLTRSLVSSSRIKSPPSQPLSTIALPTIPAASSTPRTALLSNATVRELFSSVLQPVFGRHATALRLVSLLSLVFACHLFLFDLFTGHGPSMLPTFALSGEVFLVEALSRSVLLAADESLLVRLLGRVSRIACGDVVLCRNPMRAEHSVAKRVIGLPGDQVRTVPSEAASLWRVPAGHMWLQGDCLEASRDSREYGAVPLELVRGKVVAKVWPPSKAKWIERTLQHRGY